MKEDTQDVMLSLALSQFHDATTIYWEAQEEFYKDPKPESAFLRLWFMDKILDNKMYHRNDQELSGYRQDFHWHLDRENKRREKDNRTNKPPWSKEHIEKMEWTADVFLMEMASAYIENI